MKMYFCKLLGFFQILTLSLEIGASVIDQNFEEGLQDWNVEGDISVIDGDYIKIGDIGSLGVSSLYNTFELQTGSDYLIEYDFFTNMASEVNFGVFPDLFSSSIYFSQESVSVNPTLGIYDDYMILMDIDYTGVIYSAVEAIEANDGWFRYSHQFTAQHTSAALAFELFDSNLLDDSFVFIDNVILKPIVYSVPEPSMIFLVIAIWLTLIMIHRRAGRINY